MLSISDNWFIVLMLFNLALIIIGTFMETLATIIIITPILLPVAVKLGVDPIHFGIVMIVNLSIGFITPPLGVNLFVANSISNVTNEKVFVAAIPFVISMLIALGLIILFPQISLFLPSLFYR